MAEPQQVQLLPSEFVATVAGASLGEIAELQEFVRARIVAGIESARICVEVVSRFGWEKKFAEWYVEQALERGGSIDLVLPLVEYPRPLPSEQKITGEDLANVAVAYGFVIRTTLAALLATIACGVAAVASSHLLSNLLLSVAYLAQIVATTVLVGAILRAAKHLKISPAIAIISAVLIGLLPCGFFFLVISIADHAGKYFKKAGVKMGFLGPNRESLDLAIAALSASPAVRRVDEMQR